MSTGESDNQPTIDPARASQGKTANELDHIRDILFGNQSRELEERITSLEASLATFRTQMDNQLSDQAQQQSHAMQTRAAELTQQVEQTEHSLQERLNEVTADLENLRAEMTQAIKRLEDEKTGRADLGRMLVALGERLQASAD